MGIFILCNTLFLFQKGVLMKGKFFRRITRPIALLLSFMMIVLLCDTSIGVKAAQDSSSTGTSDATVTKTSDGYQITNNYFDIQIGQYGNIESLKLRNDQYDTNYVMNKSNAPEQAAAAGHQWLGELMFKVKVGNSGSYLEENTGRSDSGRTISLDGKKVVVTYNNSSEEKGIKNFKLTETYELIGNQLHWGMKVENTNSQNITIGDWGVPLPFNEFWSAGDEIYETRTVDHSFVGQNSSYVYATRPSGLGKMLLLSPDESTGAGFEYQDHWRYEERSADEKAWCQDQSGWANGLNVFYIHSNVIKSTNRGYLPNTSLTLKPGESKTYAFKFSAVNNEKDLKSTLYKEGLIDAVAVPGMAYSVNMPGKMYLHTKLSKDDISFQIQCPHETGLHNGNSNTVSNNMQCTKNDSNTYVKYVETKIIDGEQYHIYDIKFSDLGQNNIIVKYGDGKQTTLQFYMMDDVSCALNLHSEFMVDQTQWNTPGQISDKVFDDWMMDYKCKRGSIEYNYWNMSYWGWGDDWGLTHGTYLAEKNVYQPVAKQIQAVDEYLNTAIWNGLMGQHHGDYLVHDFLMNEPNESPTYRGYAYPHIYNTYFAMYKIASKYPDMVNYIESADTYLLRAYNILTALYSDSVAYNWSTGLMGELSTPDIIAALKKEGHTSEAANIENIMSKKYNNFKYTKYPYGSEYSYDNTGEEAVYTLAKLNNSNDTANSNTMMSKINLKTRACRGLQPVWYHYANPTTICGENWWNFQYTASLAGYCMDDYLRVQDNGMTATERAEAERVNYAAKLANLTCINSGQIDADPSNVGAVAWTYQSEMGNLGGQGTGGGNLHNGWRQMSGEADLGLYGALQILSSDVVVDPVFGLFGYGCDVSEDNDTYTIKPLDGLFTRLNLINDKCYIELERDQYTKAVVNKSETAIQLSMKNLEQTAHTTNVSIQGLAPGNYEVKVNGNTTGSFRVNSKEETKVVGLPLNAASTADVVIASDDAIIVTAEPSEQPTTEPGTDKGENLALNATVTTSFVSSWETLSAVNDNQVSSVSNSTTIPHYGTWGNTSSSETVTYTFKNQVKINSCDIYFWNDGQGILTPKGYKYEYLTSNGQWTAVSNPTSYTVALDKFNETKFTPVETTAIRVTIEKPANDSTGIGLVEWRVYGSSTGSISTPSTTPSIAPSVTPSQDADDDAYINESKAGARQIVRGIPDAWKVKEGYEELYTKSICAYGVPIVSTDDVPDWVLYRAYDILEVYLRKVNNEYPEMIETLHKNLSNVIVIGEHEYNIQHPDWKDYEEMMGEAGKTERRGGADYTTTVLVDDLGITDPNSWYSSFCGLVHEFSHTFMNCGIGEADGAGARDDIFYEIKAAYDAAYKEYQSSGKYSESSYDMNNYQEYWAGQVGRWFNANGTNLNVPNANQLTEREQLKQYDPAIYAVCEKLFGAYSLIAPWGDGSNSNVGVRPSASATPSPSQSIAPTVTPSPSQSVKPSETPVPSASTPASTTGLPSGVTCEYSVVSDWGNTFQAQIVLTNNSAKTYDGWNLTFDYNSTISSLWGAELASQSGTKVVVKNPSWSATLAPGSSVTISFIATTQTTKNAPANYSLK